MKPINPNTLWHERAGRAIAYVDANYGAIVKIKRAFDRRTGRKWNRFSFGRWFHRDPAKRTEPQFGVGTALLEVAEQVIKEEQKERE